MRCKKDFSERKWVGVALKPGRSNRGAETELGTGRKWGCTIQNEKYPSETSDKDKKHPREGKNVAKTGGGGGTRNAVLCNVNKKVNKNKSKISRRLKLGGVSKLKKGAKLKKK